MNPKVRAKFRVNSITRQQFSVWKDGKTIPQEVQTIALVPVCDGSEENKKFFASTPTGKIELGTINLESAQQIELNKDYYIDFTPAE
jgi:hypothetical protein